MGPDTPGRRSPRRLSPVARKLALIVLVFVLIVGCLLFLVSAQMQIMAGVRAYVGGEGMWSKAQKNAVLHLQRYAASQDERDWRRYLDAIAVPLGDRAARLELEKRAPDLSLVRRGFIRGRNHPDDLDRMIMLFQRFGGISYMAKAIIIWTEADRHIAKLHREGEALHTAIVARRIDAATLEPILQRIRVLNARITPLEDAFSETLGEGARQLGHFLLLAICLAAALLVSLGVLLSGMLLRQIRRSEEADARLVAELEHASRLKSEFVSTMSHELRTPLNVILGYAEMAHDREAPLTRDEALARIEAAGRDLLGLIESTLEVGKIEAGRDEPRIEAIDFSAFWRTLAESCSRLPRREEVALEWSNDVPRIAVATDPRKLTVVIRNLVGNALKFTERGWVRVDARGGPNTLVLTVADTGIGIPREDQTAVFEMFRQVDGSDSRRFGGSGLGLYIVRRFVQQLGGTITLESTPRRGSTFTVILPSSARAEDEHRAA